MSKLVRSIKNVTNGYSSSQVKVRNATSNDETGPTNSEMAELAGLTFQNHELFLIMDMIDKRLNDKGKNWRHVLKALTLLDYLVHYGSDNVIIWCRENLYIIKSLREFQYRYEENGRDLGKAIRDRAKELTSLLMDAERLREVRSRTRGNGRRKQSRDRDRARDRDDRDGPRRSPDRYRRRERDRRAGRDEDMDDDMLKAIELSKQSVEDDERRRAQLRSASTDDVQKAIQISQSGVPQSNFPSLIDTSDSVYYQQPQVESVNTGYLQYSNTGMPYTQADLDQYRMAQAEFQQQQQQQQLAMQAQYEAQQAQLAQLQAQEAYLAQQQQQPQQPLEPLKTGSNNPFASFNQGQSQASATYSQVTQPPTPTQRTGSAPPPLRRQNTFDKDHMDQLDQILRLEAPADSFGNTGSSRIPAHHTRDQTMINSAGHGLRPQNTNNPFVTQQYTGIPTTQMQPAHTGYGFGNANSNGSRSNTNLIDL